MIAALIRWSVANRFLVVLATLALAIAGALVRPRSMRSPTFPTCKS